MGTSLAVQWLGLRASTAGDTGSTPGWGTKIPHAVRRSQNKTKKAQTKTKQKTKREVWVLGQHGKEDDVRNGGVKKRCR